MPPLPLGKAFPFQMAQVKIRSQAPYPLDLK